MATSNTKAGKPQIKPQRSALSGAILVGIGLAIAQVTSYLLSLISARVLGPTGYGVIASMLALLLVGSVLALGIQAAGARRIVLLPSGERRHGASGVLRSAYLAGVAVAIVTAALAAPLTWLLHLSGPVPVLLVALNLLPLTIMGGLLGVAQGREAYMRLAVLCALNGAGRAIGGIIGVIVFKTIFGALIGMTIGTFASVALAWLLTQKLIHRPATRLDHFMSEALHDTHALFVLFVLTNMDVLLARHFLSPSAAGMYAAGAVVAKVTFWLPQFVATVAYPRLADKRRSRTLGLGALIVAGIGIAATAVIAAIPNVVVQFVGGSAYNELSSEVWIFAASGSAYALAQFLLYGQLAANKNSAIIVLWVAVVSLVTLVILFHDSVLQIVLSVLGVALSVSVVGVIELLFERRKDRAMELEANAV
ncbi:MAG: lipopolysaccharide biosynthesis protein [Candidatus Nanopelagicales bacterium]